MPRGKKPVYTATCPTTPSIGHSQEDKAAVTEQGAGGGEGVYVLRLDWSGWWSRESTHVLKLIDLYLKDQFYSRIKNDIKIVNVKTHCLRKPPPPQLSPFDQVKSASTQRLKPDSWESSGGLLLPAPTSHSVNLLPGCQGVPGRPWLLPPPPGPRPGLAGLGTIYLASQPPSGSPPDSNFQASEIRSRHSPA